MEELEAENMMETMEQIMVIKNLATQLIKLIINLPEEEMMEKVEEILKTMIKEMEEEMVEEMVEIIRVKEGMENKEMVKAEV
jgi:hypothetical protein